ncbi:pancreatic triacylglycerol lipase isoform X2 [Halyomorpha halys]|uniref:pancreatic triacylglycerol lipase isoform X2 n=1 Tax=Halyomorpha halys TaxID=286706 RepID=UPI0006D4CFFB|nr:pancreatic triacylglycerol lipase isoform X2 [Halyomorpha halys]
MDLPMLFGLFLFVFLSQNFALAEQEQNSEIQTNSVEFQDPSTCFGSTVDFFLYNSEISENPEVLKVCPESSGVFTRFKNDKPLKVIIHGWWGSNERRFSKTLREGLLEKLDINVIAVDWSLLGSYNLLYSVAKKNIPKVAATFAKLLDNLNHQYGVRLEDIHVLGHSLGAHIAGVAGRMVKTGKIGRITGLDPARPSFSLDKPDERLSTNSAIFVDVIHTCGHFVGMEIPIGHADFYPNSGNFIQPGCGIDIGGFCSHRRAYYFYLESVTNRNAFPAVSCPSWNDFNNNKESCDMSRVAYLGEGLLTSTRGVYYLKTNSRAPFGLGNV